MLHAVALRGNPYDSHRLGPIVAVTQKFIGFAIERCYLDKGDRGCNAEKARRFFLSGLKRGVFGAIKREFGRSAIVAR